MDNSKTIVYYARNEGLYFTYQEDRDIETIEQLGFEVADFPKKYEIHKEKSKVDGDVMALFHKVIEECYILFFRRLINGKISAGVFSEIKFAQKLGIPVLELPTIMPSDGLSVEETRCVLRYLGER